MHRDRTLVAAVLGFVAACGGAAPPSNPTPDTGLPPAAPLPCTSFNAELSPSELLAMSCFLSGGPITSVSAPNPPPGLTVSFVPSTPPSRYAGSVLLDVSPSAAPGFHSVELEATGPGGTARWFVQVAIVAATAPGIAVGLGRADVDLAPGATQAVPIRVSSLGGFSGDVSVYVVGGSTRARTVSIVSATGSVAPANPFTTTLSVTGGYAEFEQAETMTIRAVSGLAEDSVGLGWTLPPTPEVEDVYLTLSGGPVPLRAGETATMPFDAYRSGAGTATLTFDVTAPSGLGAAVAPSLSGGVLTLAASASTPEGGSDVTVTATYGTATFTRTVRVVRPPVSGAWAYVGDGPLPLGSTETFDDGGEPRRALLPDASFDGSGIEWRAAAGGNAILVYRGGGLLDTLAVPTGTGGSTAIAMPTDFHPYVVMTAGTRIYAKHFESFGVLSNVWTSLPFLETSDLMDATSLAIAQRAGELFVVHGQRTPIATSVGFSGIVGWRWDGSQWWGAYLPAGTLPSTIPAGLGAHLTSAIDGAGNLVFGWIGADGSAHVSKLISSSWVTLPVIAPSTGHVLSRVDLAVTAGDAVHLLVHETSDPFASEHPGLGVGDRLRVFDEAGSAWSERPEVTLPDARARVTDARLGLGPTGDVRCVFRDATGVYAADPR